MLAERTIIAGYRIERIVGRGGMGTVFRARHVESDRIVALKILADTLAPDPDFEARFRREGRVQASLEHPHVATVYEAGTSEHGLFLAMRLVEGPALADLIRDRELDVRRALALLEQVADALDAAHAAGLVHRDVKPHNVLVGAGDHAYLADFGLTRARDTTAVTVPDAILGTVAYLAPEAVRGDETTAAADRYALAAMAFECLTGTAVFPRTSDAAVLFAHVNEPPPRIGARRPELGTRLDDLFERALAKDPSERPASARDLMAAIRRALEPTGAVDLPAAAPTGATALGRDTPTDQLLPPRDHGAPSRSRRRLVLATLGGAAVAAALAGAAWAAFGDTDAKVVPMSLPERAGLRYIGAALDGPPGRPLDCRGRAPTPSSPPCTVVQSDLSGATVVVPADGVIRHWGVRAARGELRLVVLRPRGPGAFQVTMSSTETVGSADVQSFDTDLAVDRGDLLALKTTPGSAVGIRDGAPGAATERWLPPLAGLERAPERGAGTGFDHELLLRVGLRPGGELRPSRQVSGSAAQGLPTGRRLRSRSVRLAGQRIEFVLVQVSGRFAVDQIVDGRRIARIDVPEMRPNAHIVRFVAAEWGPELAGLDLHFVNESSARVVQLGYESTLRAFRLLR